MTKYQFIISTIKEAGEILLESRKKNIDITTKDDYRDLVTNVDLEVNDFISKSINAAYPGEIIFSEESKQNIETSNSYWTIDPIDGTSNFARGIPSYAIVLAWVENGESVIGAIYNPITRELFSFEKGKGSFLNNEKINTSSISDIKESYVLLHIGRKEELREWGINLQKFFLANAKKNINFASSALDLCFLASGRVDIVIYGTLTTKDISAAIGLVRGAGGEVYDSHSAPVSLSDIPQKIFAVANKELFEKMKMANILN